MYFYFFYVPSFPACMWDVGSNILDKLWRFEVYIYTRETSYLRCAFWIVICNPHAQRIAIWCWIHVLLRPMHAPWPSCLRQSETVTGLCNADGCWFLPYPTELLALHAADLRAFCRTLSTTCFLFWGSFNHFNCFKHLQVFLITLTMVSCKIPIALILDSQAREQQPA